MSSTAKRRSACQVMASPSLVTKSKPAVSSKGYKALRRKEPRLCYSVSKAEKESSNPPISSGETSSKKGGSQSKARRSASVHSVGRARSSLAERHRQRERRARDDDSVIHSEEQRNNSCLNAVEMNSRTDATLVSGATLLTPRDNNKSAVMRSFASSTSGYGSLLRDSLLDETPIFSAEPRSTPREAQDQSFRGRTETFDQQATPRHRMRSLTGNASIDTANDFLVEELLTGLSDKMRRVGDQLSDPLLRRTLAELEIDIQDLRVRCGNVHKVYKDNGILRKRISLSQIALKNEQDKAAEQHRDDMLFIKFINDENTVLARALLECNRSRPQACDAATQTASEMKDAATDAEPLAAKLDDTLPTKDAASQSGPLWSVVNEVIGQDPTQFLHAFRERHPDCRMEETSAVLNGILNGLDRVPAEKPQSPPSVRPPPKPTGTVRMLTKENLSEHDRRYLHEEVSSGQPAAKPKAAGETAKATTCDSASDRTLVEADKASEKSTRVAYIPDNDSVFSRVSYSSTLSSLKSMDHRLFEEVAARVGQKLMQVERNFLRAGAASHPDDVTACVF